MSPRRLRKFFRSHVKGVPKGTIVPFLRQEITPWVNISTKALKHIYEKRTALEFDLFLGHLKSLVEHPTSVYGNKSGKSGTLCLVNIIFKNTYILILEKQKGRFEIVTFFQIDQAYISSYELLWKRRMATPHRNAWIHELTDFGTPQ